jgi:hypothetical protein
MVPSLFPATLLLVTKNGGEVKAAFRGEVG